MKIVRIWRFIATNPLASNSYTKFEILLVKTFNLKEKACQILPTTLKNTTFCLFKRKVMKHSSRLWIIMGNIKQKPFKANVISPIKTWRQPFGHIPWYRCPYKLVKSLGNTCEWVHFNENSISDVCSNSKEINSFHSIF